jgi:3-hydroxyacyl-[acyl-carrier-protein] dehydratase
MNIHEILKLLPHRYPFLLVDRVLEYTPGKNLTALKNVSINEPFFAGHFPCRPVMPGVLILESLAQATGLLAYQTLPEQPGEDSLFYFVGIDNARFKQPVYPGDQMFLHIELLRTLRGVWKFAGEAKVDGRLVATAEMMCALRALEP